MNNIDPIETVLKNQFGVFRIICFPNGTLNPDIALVKGNVNNSKGVLTRIQSECFTGHVFHSFSCDCYDQLNDSLSLISSNEKGILIYLRQEGRGIGIEAKLKSYILQKQGLDTVEANVQLGFKVDERTYDNAIKILQYLKIESIKLITNNPKKIEGLNNLGIQIVETIGIPPLVREENKKYLKTKVNKMGHVFEMEND